MRTEKKYTHLVIVILLLIGVAARTVYGAIRAAWKPIQDATSCEYTTATYQHDFNYFFENNQPSVWDIIFNMPEVFLTAMVLVAPIYISYLISRRFFSASFAFKAYLLWYVFFGISLILDTKGIVKHNCHQGAAYIGFFVMHILAFFAVPTVLGFLVLIELVTFNLENKYPKIDEKDEKE